MPLITKLEPLMAKVVMVGAVAAITRKVPLTVNRLVSQARPGPGAEGTMEGKAAE